MVNGREEQILSPILETTIDLAVTNTMQKFQDWFTQQWAIFRGKKIDPQDTAWLMGPFGNLDGIGDDFIGQLAARENLIIARDAHSQGLIPSIAMLNLPSAELAKLSPEVIRFYENTAAYNLHLTVNWNPLFRFFGVLVNKLFSNRINQLNVPTKNIKDPEAMQSEIITLSDPKTNQVKYTIWFRTFRSSGQIIYSGVYETCQLPSGKTCIKAVFPLPKGNATVIMLPSVGPSGELVLDASGKLFGDAGFYFLLNDSKGNYWSQFLGTFRDRLVIRAVGEHLEAEQTLTLWHQRVLTFNYQIAPQK